MQSRRPSACQGHYHALKPGANATSHAHSLPLHLQAEVRRFLQAMAAKGTHGSNRVFSISELFSLADAIHLNVESVRDLIEGLNEAGQCQTLAHCTCKMRCAPLPASCNPFKVDKPSCCSGELLKKGPQMYQLSRTQGPSQSQHEGAMSFS